MNIQKKQTLKKFTYVCLYFSSILTSFDCQARLMEGEVEDKKTSITIPYVQNTDGVDLEGPNFLAPNSNRSSFSEDKLQKDLASLLQEKKGQISFAATISNEGIKEKYTERYRLIGISLFSGQDCESKVINTATLDSISHVGLILSDIDNPNNNQKNWYSFESTGSLNEFLKSDFNWSNYLEKWKTHLQVQINPWEEVVKDYNGSVSYRLFQFDNLISEEDKIILSNGITKAVKEYGGISYTTNPAILINAILRTNERRHTMPTSTFFCSELVAQVLMNLDILAAGKPGNFQPKDFRSNRTLSERAEVGFILRMGITLSDEQIKK